MFIITKILLIIKQIELVKKKKFVIVAFNSRDKIFAVFIVSFISFNSDIHSFCRTKLVFLFINKALIVILFEYANFIDIFSLKYITELSKHIKNYYHLIYPIDSQQPHYKSIHSLKPVELEILKTFIEINLANSFIKPFKLPMGTSILFV